MDEYKTAYNTVVAHSSITEISYANRAGEMYQTALVTIFL
jgi:hypothetical protein